MKIIEEIPSRKFKTGLKKQIIIKDSGKIILDEDEQVTFYSEDEKEYDVTKKNWGYYATPSINGRLKMFNYSTALVENSIGNHYIMIVDNEKKDLFKKYIDKEKLEVIKWLSND